MGWHRSQDMDIPAWEIAIPRGRLHASQSHLWTMKTTAAPVLVAAGMIRDSLPVSGASYVELQATPYHKSCSARFLLICGVCLLYGEQVPVSTWHLTIPVNRLFLHRPATDFHQQDTETCLWTCPPRELGRTSKQSSLRCGPGAHQLERRPQAVILRTYERETEGERERGRERERDSKCGQTCG